MVGLKNKFAVPFWFLWKVIWTTYDTPAFKYNFNKKSPSIKPKDNTYTNSWNIQNWHNLITYIKYIFRTILQENKANFKDISTYWSMIEEIFDTN